MNNYCAVDVNIECSESYYMSFSFVYFNSILATTSFSVVLIIYISVSSAPTNCPVTAQLIQPLICSGPLYWIVSNHSLLASNQLYLIHFQYHLYILNFFSCSLLSSNPITIISTMFTVNPNWLFADYDTDRYIFHGTCIWIDSNYSNTVDNIDQSNNTGIYSW